MGIYTVDGVSLHNPGRWTTHKTSERRPAATFRAVSTSIPGVDGDLPIYAENIEFKALKVVLNVYDGGDGLEANLDALFGLLGRSPLVVEKTIGGRTVYAEAKPASLTPSAEHSVYSQLTATLTIPSGVWRGAEATWDHPAPTVDDSQEILTLAGSTRQVTDAQILITGPAENINITDSSTSALTWKSSVPAGQALFIDCAAYSAALGAEVTWGDTTGNATKYLDSLGPGSDVNLLTIVPNPTGEGSSSSLKFTATGRTSATQLQVRARPAFL